MEQEPKHSESSQQSAPQENPAIVPRVASRPKAKHHKEIQLKTLDETKLKELSQSVSASIEVLTFRLENKGLFDAQGIYFNNAMKLFANKGAKKVRIYLANNPVTHITLEEICKNIIAYLPNLVHLVLQLDQTLVNDQAINYIFEMLRSIGEYLKVFEISLTGSSVTDIGMSDLFQSLKFLSLECDVYVGNEDSETLQTLAKEFSSYKKFQRMLQQGGGSQSESEEDDEESDEEGAIKIRNLDEEDSDTENDVKKKTKKEQTKKPKKKKGLLKTTQQKNQFNQMPQLTPQMLAGINPLVVQQMYSQMMQQSQMPMNKMMNPYMWQMQQKQMQMQNMMMWQMQQQQQQSQQSQAFSQLQKNIKGIQKGEEKQDNKLQSQQQQQQFTPQMMNQQAKAFQQLQKSIKEAQKTQASGEQKNNEIQENNEQTENKTKQQANIPIGFNQQQQQQLAMQQQQQQMSAFSELQRNLKEISKNQGGVTNIKQNETGEEQQKQITIQQQAQNQPSAMPRIVQQPQQKPQVNDFELILEKLRSQQTMLSQQQQLQNQSNENIPQIGKPVQAIPPGFKQKSAQQSNSQTQAQEEQQQSLQKSIESYFANLQLQQPPQSQQQQQNQKQSIPKENQPVETSQGYQNKNLFQIF